MISYQEFFEEIREKLEQNKRELRKQIENARDESAIITKWYNDLEMELSELEIYLQVERLHDFFEELRNEYLCDKQLTHDEAFQKILLKKADQINLEKLKTIQRYKVLIDTKNHINTEIYFKPQTNKTYKLKWKSKNETEFIQLMHGLIEIGRIDIGNEKSNWNVIRKIADFFSVELSKNAISNFSKSYKNRNNDYIPKIFQDLMENFEKKMNN